MQVDDGGACLGGAQGALRDLVRGDRQIRRHRGGVDRAGDGAGDNDLASVCHECVLLVNVPGAHWRSGSWISKSSKSQFLDAFFGHAPLQSQVRALDVGIVQ